MKSAKGFLSWGKAIVVSLLCLESFSWPQYNATPLLCNNFISQRFRCCRDGGGVTTASHYSVRWQIPEEFLRGVVFMAANSGTPRSGLPAAASVAPSGASCGGRAAAAAFSAGPSSPGSPTARLAANTKCQICQPGLWRRLPMVQHWPFPDP